MSKIFHKPFRPLDWSATPHDFTGDNQLGPHTSETTQRYIYGTRFLTWDGKVWKYSKSTASCYTERGNMFYNKIYSDTNGIDYSVLTADQSAGDREITLTNGSTTAIGEDDLAGGLIVIVPSETYTDGEVMHRGIIGNEAAATSAECRMFLDYPIETAVTTSEYAYVMPSSYSNLRYGDTSGTRSIAGLAGTYVTGTGYNFWTQTYGACQITNGGPQTCGKTAFHRAVWWSHDGTIKIFDSTPTSDTTDQVAGFVLDNNSDADGSTNIMMTNSY